MIDFVITWVNGNDPEWIKEYNNFSGSRILESSRFRDWDNLQYWFRGVEMFTPWVNNIFFVTWGHIPSWLNINHPKLKIIKHSDFIPSEYLPTFNSHTIELNLHRIPGLGQKFVYFNDDHFILRQIDPTRFFYKNTPCDMAVLNVLQPNDNGIDHIQANNISLINRHFDKRITIRQNPAIWFNYKYKALLYRTIVLNPWSLFTGFVDPHMPNAYLKSTFESVWAKEYQTLHNTCNCRLRNLNNVNQYIFRYWQICNGNIYPINIFNDSKFYQFDDLGVKNICQEIIKRKSSIICISDTDNIKFLEAKKQINDALCLIFPNKSDFER